MIYAILVVIYVVCGLMILQTTGIKRLLIFYIGILYVPGTFSIIPQSMLMGHFFYLSMFILSMIRFHEFNAKNFQSCPLFIPLLIVFISYFLIGLFDERVSKSLAIYRSIREFLGTYFLFFVGWTSLESEDRKYSHIGVIPGIGTEYNKFFKYLIPITVFMTVYGFVTLFFKTNPVLDAIGLKDRFFNELDTSFRSFRVTAMCVSSSVYGMLCGVIFLCGAFFIENKNKTQIAALALLFINVFLSATRAAMIPFIFGLLIFLILNKGITGFLRNILLVIIVALLIYPLLPSSVTFFVTGVLDSIYDSVFPGGSGGAAYKGSNLDAREMQIGTAFQLLKENPWFGHGFGYAGEVLLHGNSHQQLLGMESYLCYIGIERGLVNLFAEVWFYISCVVYFFRHRSINKLYADMGVSLITFFIPFLIFAWVSGCWFFFMPVLGYITKAIFLSENTLPRSVL